MNAERKHRFTRRPPPLPSAARRPVPLSNIVDVTNDAVHEDDEPTLPYAFAPVVPGNAYAMDDAPTVVSVSVFVDLSSTEEARTRELTMEERVLRRAQAFRAPHRAPRLRLVPPAGPRVGATKQGW